MIRQQQMTQSAFFETHRIPQQGQQAQEEQQHLFRLPSLPIDMRLKENKQRRMILEYERMKQKERIIKKRKEKQENVQRVLRQRSEAKENAKLMFDPCLKTCGNRFGIDLDWKKAEDIQNKIQQSRAQQYRTLYQKKIHKEIQEKQKNAKKRVLDKENKSLQKSLNYHLAEWNQYEKKIAKKYQGEKINEKRLYQTYFKKEGEIKKLLNDHKNEVRRNQKNSQIQIDQPKRLLGKAKRQKTQNSKVHVQNNPIFLHGELSTFGLQKSMKNPEKILESFLKFIEDRAGVLFPSEDLQLLEKFQKYLEKDIQL